MFSSKHVIYRGSSGVEQRTLVKVANALEQNRLMQDKSIAAIAGYQLMKKI